MVQIVPYKYGGTWRTEKPAAGGSTCGRQHGRDEKESQQMKAIATLVAATVAAFLFGTGTAKACEYDCYDSGNTGEHCEYTNC